MELPKAQGEYIGLVGQNFAANLRREAYGIESHGEDPKKPEDILKTTFGRYLSPDVAEAVLSGDVRLGGDRKEVSLLYLTSVSFPVMAVDMEPEDEIAIINGRYGKVVGSILDYGGTIDRFDQTELGLMAVFNNPVSYPDHAQRALRSAMSINKILENDEIDHGVGIVTGRVVAGNIGSHRRVEYTVIGRPVREARLLASLAAIERTLLLDESAYHQAKDIIPASSVIEFRRSVSGKKRNIYQVAGPLKVS